MNQVVTQAIVLSRTSYGEADRIISVLTPDKGKVRLLAKGVRKIKSKMAGGIELFSVSTIGYIQGRGELATLVSTRLDTHYSNIVKDINRTMFTYDILKRINKVTEDHTDTAYFALLQSALGVLDNHNADVRIILPWFEAQLMSLGGAAPNLRTDTNGSPLDATVSYIFSFEDMAFSAGNGPFTAKHIKLLRILFASRSGGELVNVQTGAQDVLPAVSQLIATLAKQHI